MLTRRQAARRAGVPAQLLPDRPDLIHIGGDWLEEVYCEFQFDENGVRRDLGRVVHDLHRDFSDIEIADWLVRPNQALNGNCPLDFLGGRGTVDQVLAAATIAPPITDPIVEPQSQHPAPPDSYCPAYS